MSKSSHVKVLFNKDIHCFLNYTNLKLIWHIGNPIPMRRKLLTHQVPENQICRDIGQYISVAGGYTWVQRI